MCVSELLTSSVHYDSTTVRVLWTTNYYRERARHHAFFFLSFVTALLLERARLRAAAVVFCCQVSHHGCAQQDPAQLLRGWPHLGPVVRAVRLGCHAQRTWSLLQDIRASLRGRLLPIFPLCCSERCSLRLKLAKLARVLWEQTA